MTIEDARDMTATAIARACEQMLPGAITALKPSELAGRWGGAPAVLAGLVGRHFRHELNSLLDDMGSGLKVTHYAPSVGWRRRSAMVFVIRRCGLQEAQLVAKKARRRAA